MDVGTVKLSYAHGDAGVSTHSIHCCLLKGQDGERYAGIHCSLEVLILGCTVSGGRDCSGQITDCVQQLFLDLWLHAKATRRSTSLMKPAASPGGAEELPASCKPLSIDSQVMVHTSEVCECVEAILHAILSDVWQAPVSEVDAGRQCVNGSSKKACSSSCSIHA